MSFEGIVVYAANARSSDAASTKLRPRLNHHASTEAVPSAAYGPAVRRPTSESGRPGPSQRKSTVAARIAAGSQAGRSALSGSTTQLVGPESCVAHASALRSEEHTS